MFRRGDRKRVKIHHIRNRDKIAMIKLLIIYGECFRLQDRIDMARANQKTLLIARTNHRLFST